MSYRLPESPLRGYRPQIYSVGSRTRFRPYPAFTRTPVPGAGFHVRPVFATQPLLLGLGAAPSGGRYRRRARVVRVGMGDARSTVETVADILRDPEGALRRKSGELVLAFDRYVLTPTIDRSAERITPYAMKYFLPPYLLLLTVAGVGAYFAWKGSRA